MYLILRRVLLVFMVFVTSYSHAQLSTAKIFGDHMVLQRNVEVPIWGWNKPREKVTISFNGQKVTTTTDENGKWLARLKPMKEGGPFEIQINGKNDKIVYSDVMIGEVWLCSGQSNMQWSLAAADGGLIEIAKSESVPIRQFSVAQELSLEPEKGLKNGQWEKASPKTAGNFTAVGYFFAKEIAAKLNVTVGLIHSSWGGSQAEGWISKGDLLGMKELGLDESYFPKKWEDADKLLSSRLIASVSNASGVAEYHADKLLSANARVFETWKEGSLPGSWDWQGFPAYRGNGWFMKEVEVYGPIVAKESTLNLANYDNSYTIYINGSLVEEGTGQNNLSVKVKPGTWKEGKNILLMKLATQKEPWWHGVGIAGDAKNLNIDFGGTKIPLDGKWRFMPVLNEEYHFTKFPNNIASSIYNAMIAPLVPYALKGFLWYQGESNAGRAKQYHTTFKGLIQNWRRDWKGDLPFLFVQLSSYGSNDYSHPGSDWAELREAQQAALQLPNTGMAVTIDVGNANDIHPTNKKDVGQRLALNALNNTYHIPTPYSGPVFKSVSYANGKAVVRFEFADKGLIAKDNYGYVKGFEVAGADKQFHFAKAEIKGPTIEVWSDSVSTPVAVRYAWSNAPIDANVFNTEGLPLAPFRTDTWEGVTDREKFK